MIWGISGEKKRVGTELEDFQCPKCSDVGEVNAEAYCKYLHIVWIPTFSIGKRSKFFCYSCETKIKKKFIPTDLHHVADQLKNHVKIPFTHFIGSIIIALFIIAVIVIGITSPSKPSIKPMEALQSPQVGDIYSVHVSEEEDLYSTWKVVNFDKDSIYIFKNKVEIEGAWEFLKNKSSESAQMFTTDTISFSKEKLIELYDAEFITDVDRAFVSEEE